MFEQVAGIAWKIAELDGESTWRLHMNDASSERKFDASELRMDRNLFTCGRRSTRGDEAAPCAHVDHMRRSDRRHAVDSTRQHDRLASVLSTITLALLHVEAPRLRNPVCGLSEYERGDDMGVLHSWQNERR